MFVKSQYVCIFYHLQRWRTGGWTWYIRSLKSNLSAFIFVCPKMSKCNLAIWSLTGSEKRIWRCLDFWWWACSSSLSANWQCITMPHCEGASAENTLPAASSYLYHTSTGLKAFTASESITTSRHPSQVIR